jgi:myosin heavy subunit
MSLKDDIDLPRIEVQDLISLGNLNEHTMLETIRLRYAANLIYTWTGTILVSINPFVLLPIYTPEIVQKYLKNSHSQPPHIFAVADRAYKDMIAQNRNQCALISGESGAGKTEATKLMLQFLAAITHKHSQIEQQILEVNPILEAFGNAKTIRNNNSSRFGRFTEIQFSHKLDGIVGAQITEYLLEKSRIAFQAPNERNYHVFYQLLAGASPEEKKDLALKAANQYNYLNKSKCIEVEGIDDGADFDALRLAMDSLLISADVQRTIFAVLSSVLHLGNVEFVGKDEARVDEKSMESIHTVSKLLGFDSNALVKALTTRSITVRGQTTILHLKHPEAIDGRDALAKALYGNMFSWLVRIINKTLSAPKGSARLQIGILDIFGFEHFKINSFEQLMINFTNEKLQQQFNNFIFKLEQEEYEKEKINWSSIKFVDNQDVLDLIEKRPLGILSILDEECKFPSASDQTFLDKLHSNHVKNPRYTKPKMVRPEFGVEHFAGQVMYNVEKFLEKNKDTLGDAVRDLLQSAKVSLVKDMFAEVPSSDASSDPADKGKLAKPTVGLHFKNQLNLLMSALSTCSPHYVRCIKPNFDKLPLTFDSELVSAQLRYAGMLETIRIRRLGYPQRLPLKDFHSRYKCLLEGKFRTENIKKDIANLFAEVLKESQDHWQIGLTKVFMKDHHKGEFEQLRNTRLTKSCLVIQKTWRMYSVKKKYSKLKKGAIEIQAAFRMHMYRKRYVTKKKSTVLIQSVWKMWKVRRQFLNTRRKIIGLQAIIRRVVSSKRYKASFGAAEVLQTGLCLGQQ